MQHGKEPVQMHNGREFTCKRAITLANHHLKSVNVNLKAQLILPRIKKSSQLNEIKLLLIEKNYIRRFEN